MKNLFFTFFLLVFIQAGAQINTENRIEFDLRNGYSGETIYESSKGYFVLESKADDYVDGQAEIKYDLYNGDLELEKTESVLVPKKMMFRDLYYNDDYVYNMFATKAGEFVITGVQMSTLEISKTTGVLPPKAYLRSMKVLGDQVYFLATIKKAPVIYKVDLGSGKGTTIPISIGAIPPKSIFSENYQILEKTNEILLFVNAYPKKGLKELHMIRITESDDVEKPLKISGIGDNSIVSISGCRIDVNKIIITGTYAKKGGMSEGLFFGEVEDGTVNYISYYNFLDLKDFLSYLPEKKQEKIEKKKEKKEAQGKELTLDYWIADHDVIVLEDGYLFLGEAYYPTYRTESYTTYVNGKPVTQYRTVFDGYQYTHATLGKFSKEGEMMWDVCFELNPGYKPFFVKRFIAISEQTATQISMVYTSGNEIVSKTMDFDGNIISDEKWDFIETGNSDDKAKRTFSNVDHWYGNYFLAYGSQVIKNGKEKRKVYFVNKIGF
ncbi:hypothetical protein SDC9_58587 [bioreactor metagenome]|uniref:Uncharacterized protein n=1 Tax=bioreactor metagenome TaxID=1076179 RepID=A0A644X7T7_9ZZZZ